MKVRWTSWAPVPNKPTVSVDVKQHFIIITWAPRQSVRSQDLCKSRGGRPGLPVPNSPYGLYGRKATLNRNEEGSELRSGVKVEVAVLGSPSIIVLMVSVDVKQQ